jgi:hypothetical protein
MKLCFRKINIKMFRHTFIDCWIIKLMLKESPAEGIILDFRVPATTYNDRGIP